MNFLQKAGIGMLIAMLSILDAYSQISINSYAELGTTNVSAGAYGNFSGLLSAKFGAFSVSTGALVSVSNADLNVFSAYKLSVDNEFQLFKTPFRVSGFYLWKPFSVDLRETNAGVLVNYRTRHFGYDLGLNTRVYGYSEAAKRKYNFLGSASTTIWEPVNWMYKLTYYLQFNPKTNFEACVTNFDTYMVEQETNPMIRTKINYELNNKLHFYSELGYQQAGLMNIRVNTFGVFLRGGVVWQLN